MNKIIIEFLAPEEYSKSVYTVAIPYFLGQKVIKCDTANDIIEALQRIDTNTAPLIVTFLGHGNQIRLGKLDDKLPFENMLSGLNQCRTIFPLYVNLMANCNSYGIKDFLQYGQNIDEFWVVTDDSRSISKALLATIDNGDSDCFLEPNDAGTGCLYIKYIKGKEVKECDLASFSI